MAKKFLERGAIDEMGLRSAMSVRRYDSPSQVEALPPEQPPAPEPDIPAVAKPAAPGKTAATDFERRFMRMVETPGRKQIWIGGETKRKLTDVVRLIGDDRTNLQSYVELILIDHIEAHRDEINRIYQSRTKKKEVL